MTREFVITVEQGKWLIARALASDAALLDAARNRRVLIVAGTTNASVALALLQALDLDCDFDRIGFRRGVTLAPGEKLPPAGPTHDLLIDHGRALFESDVFEYAPRLEAGDVILKGANALYLPDGECGVLIGNNAVGTTLPIITAVVGRRVKLIVPVGLEKRVDRPISALMEIANRPDGTGPRLINLPGQPYTELDAVRALTGCSAELIAAGGIMGAQGCVYIAATGEEAQLDKLAAILSEY